MSEHKLEIANVTSGGAGVRVHEIASNGYFRVSAKCLSRADNWTLLEIMATDRQPVSIRFNQHLAVPE